MKDEEENEKKEKKHINFSHVCPSQFVFDIQICKPSKQICGKREDGTEEIFGEK